MPGVEALSVFALAAVAILAVPGPSVLFIVSQSITNGRNGGFAAMLGVQAGGVLHVVAASIGVSAIVASSATAFSFVKYVGAAYLIWLGLQRFRERDARVDRPSSPVSRRPGQLFRRGFVVNALNPKTALFFLAVLPQFIDRTTGTPWLQSMILGALFIGIAVITDGIWVLAAGWLAERIRRPRARRLERLTTSGVLVGLGLAAAFTERSTP